MSGISITIRNVKCFLFYHSHLILEAMQRLEIQQNGSKKEMELLNKNIFRACTNIFNCSLLPR